MRLRNLHNKSAKDFWLLGMGREGAEWGGGGGGGAYGERERVLATSLPPSLPTISSFRSTAPTPKPAEKASAWGLVFTQSVHVGGWMHDDEAVCNVRLVSTYVIASFLCRHMHEQSAPHLLKLKPWPTLCSEKQSSGAVVKIEVDVLGYRP